MNWSIFLVLLLGCTFLGSCTSESQKKEEPRAEDLRPESAHGSGSHEAASSPLTFKTPDGWVEEKPTSSSRQMQFRLPRVKEDKEDAQLVVSYFPGGGGTPQANVDRWIGQFTTQDGKPASDKARTTHKDINGMHVTVVDVSGTYFNSMGPMQGSMEPKPGFRMLGAIAEAESGPWFIKLTGPERTVAHWEPGFHQFLASMKQ